MATDEEWVSVQDAARTSGVAARTIYSWIKGKRLRSKSISRLQHVTVADVHTVAARLQTPEPSGPAAQPPANETSGTLARAREDLEVTRVETERLRVEAAAIKAKDELVLADAERDKRRQVNEIELERQRLALRREQVDHDRAVAETEALEAAENRRRLAETENMRLRRERERAARNAAQRRDQWLRAWLKRATDWVVAEGLAELAGPVLPVVREALHELGPDDPPTVVEDAIYHSVLREFSTEVAERHQAVLRQIRANTARAASQVARYEGASAQHAVYAAARAAADEVDPETDGGRDHIYEAARLELGRLRAEAWEEEQLGAAQRRRQEDEAERTRQDRARVAEAHHRQMMEQRHRENAARAWSEVERDVPALARSVLPVGCTEAELASGEAEILRALNASRHEITAATFRGDVYSLLAQLARQVKERLRAEEDEALWRQTFSLGLVDLDRRLPAEATASEREVAENLVTTDLEALRGRGSAVGAQAAIGGIVMRAMVPVQRRLAVERAIAAVPAAADDRVAIAVIRAAMRAVNKRADAWSMERAAADAVRHALESAARP